MMGKGFDSGSCIKGNLLDLTVRACNSSLGPRVQYLASYVHGSMGS